MRYVLRVCLEKEQASQATQARDAATAVEAGAGANGNTNMYADMLLGAAADDAAFVPKVVGSNSAAAAGPAHSAGSSTAVFDG